MSESVAARIMEFRDDRGWSRSELARRVNTTPTQIRKLEEGELQISLEWMRKFARVFETKIGALLPPDEMDVSNSPELSQLLEIFRDTPADERPTLLAAAREIAGAVRRITTLKGGPALGGDPLLATAMSDVWQRWDHSQRTRALELFRVMGL